MADFVYNAGADGLTDGSINWATDTIKYRLISSSATPNKDDDDLSSGYTAIGTDQTLGSKTRTKNDTTDRIVYDAADPTFTAVAGGATVGWGIIYKDAGGGTLIPIAAHDLPNTATNGGDMTVALSADGAFYLQQ